MKEHLKTKPAIYTETARLIENIKTAALQNIADATRKQTRSQNRSASGADSPKIDASAVKHIEIKRRAYNNPLCGKSGAYGAPKYRARGLEDCRR
jgi:hypothetical protein